MPRSPRRPLASRAPDIDRKAIEQRAREAAMPAPVEEKGRWPFPLKDIAGDSPRSEDAPSMSRDIPRNADKTP
jgi:hypothetical protein